MEWVPTYEALYEAEKLGLRHTSRSVYTGLCLKARKDKGDRVRLPRGKSLVDGVWQLVGGDRVEVEDALRDDPQSLLFPKDPMIRVEGEEGMWTVVVLAQPRWALQGHRPPADETAAASTLPTSSGSPEDARRAAEAKRKRDARARARTQHAAPDTSDHASGQDAGRTTGHDPDASADAPPDASGQRPPDASDSRADAGGVRGGLSGVQTQKRTEEKRVEETRDARADASGRTTGHDPDASHGHGRTEGRTRVRFEDRTGLPDVATPDDLLEAVGEHPMLQTLHRDRRWAMNAASGFATEACLRVDVFAAVRTFVKREAARAPSDEPALDRWVRDNIGRYLAGAKRFGAEERARAARQADRTNGPGAPGRPRGGPPRLDADEQLAGLPFKTGLEGT